MSSDINETLTEDMAIVEVGKVLEAARRHGAYSSVVFDDPVTQAVLARAYGGWAKLCSECDAQGFQREFVRTWMAYFRQGVKHFGHLPGILETANRYTGFSEQIPPPKLIGDQEKAHAVLEYVNRAASMSSKPKLKPGTSGAARMECYACYEDAESLLAQGYTVTSVYEHMKKYGRVTCSNTAFADYLHKWRARS